MVKETTTTKALTDSRQLTSMVGNYNNVFDNSEEQFPGMGNWLPIPLLGVSYPVGVYSETRIDLNLSLDSLTFFPGSIFLQDPGLYERTPSSLLDDTAERMMVYDIVSTKVLDVATIANGMLFDDNAAPGMLGTPDDMNQITMGSFRLMARNSQLIQGSQIQTVVQKNDFSGAVPFAQDVLYCYRIVMLGATSFSGTRLRIPASRFVIQGAIGQEDELPYMMRLKNSYELLEKV